MKRWFGLSKVGMFGREKGVKEKKEKKRGKGRRFK